TKGKTIIVFDTAEIAAAIAAQAVQQGVLSCPAAKARPPVPRYVRRGTATVRGRTGDAWYTQAADGTFSVRPEMVISHDPALAPLSAAMLAQSRATDEMVPPCPGYREALAAGEAVLAGGAPLLTTGI